jgi:hypothetical protein
MTVVFGIPVDSVSRLAGHGTHLLSISGELHPFD